MNNNLDFEEESKVAENWYKIYPMSLQTFRINLISFKAIFILDRYDEHIQITFATRYEWWSNCIEFRFPKLMGTNVTLLKRETMAISRC